MTQIVQLLDTLTQALREVWRHATPHPTAGALLDQAEQAVAALKADPGVMGLAATPEPTPEPGAPAPEAA